MKKTKMFQKTIVAMTLMTIAFGSGCGSDHSAEKNVHETMSETHSESENEEKKETEKPTEEQHFRTFWEESDGKHYYNENGVSVTGWYQADGTNWYFFDKEGVMKTGLINDGGKTYYSDNQGRMLTGWQEIHGKKYYFGNDGAMMKRSWIEDTYYVGDDGEMMVSGKTPDGKKVGKDGKKIDESWKDVIINFLQNIEKETGTGVGGIYGLCDVNGDGIPEIYMHYGQAEDLIAVNGDKMDGIAQSRCGIGITNNGIIEVESEIYQPNDDGSDRTFIWFTWYKLKSGEGFQKIGDETDFITTYDDGREDEHEITVNGKPSDEEEFWKERKRITGLDKDEHANDIPLWTYDNIDKEGLIEVIRNWGD